MIMEEEHELKPYSLIRQDGSKETVYLKGEPINQRLTFKDHLMIAYVLAGIVGIGVTVFFTINQMKKS